MELRRLHNFLNSFNRHRYEDAEVQDERDCGNHESLLAYDEFEGLFTHEQFELVHGFLTTQHSFLVA
jgi:hypothetical protein